jgi:hypothetical protein
MESLEPTQDDPSQNDSNGSRIETPSHGGEHDQGDASNGYRLQDKPNDPPGLKHLVDPPSQVGIKGAASDEGKDWYVSDEDGTAMAGHDIVEIGHPDQSAWTIALATEGAGFDHLVDPPTVSAPPMTGSSHIVGDWNGVKQQLAPVTNRSLSAESDQDHVGLSTEATGHSVDPSAPNSSVLRDMKIADRPITPVANDDIPSSLGDQALAPTIALTATELAADHLVDPLPVEVTHGRNDNREEDRQGVASWTVVEFTDGPAEHTGMESHLVDPATFGIVAQDNPGRKVMADWDIAEQVSTAEAPDGATGDHKLVDASALSSAKVASVHNQQSIAGPEQWTPGNRGKGLFNELNNEVRTWNVDNTGYPHHTDVGPLKDYLLPNNQTALVISPDGRVNVYADHPEAYEQYLTQHHPALHVPDTDWRVAATEVPSWSPGNYGKGLVYNNEVKTWNADTGIHHVDMMRPYDPDDYVVQLLIQPDGKVVEPGNDRRNIPADGSEMRGYSFLEPQLKEHHPDLHLSDGNDWGWGTHEAGATDAQRQRLVEAWENERPDGSQLVHQFPNDWSIRKLQDVGDKHREGVLMRNCWRVGDERHWLPKVIDQPLNPQEHGGWSHYSLRDHNNYPHVSFYGREPRDEYEQGRVDNFYGHGNSEVQPEYAQMIKQWADQVGYTGAPDSWYEHYPAIEQEQDNPVNLLHPPTNSSSSSRMGKLSFGSEQPGSRPSTPDDATKDENPSLVQKPWTPGNYGKGLIYPDRVVSWNVDEYESPHHADMGGYASPSVPIHIGPSGQVENWGSGDLSEYSELLAQHHPQLHVPQWDWMSKSRNRKANSIMLDLERGVDPSPQRTELGVPTVSSQDGSDSRIATGFEYGDEIRVNSPEHWNGATGKVVEIYNDLGRTSYGVQLKGISGIWTYLADELELGNPCPNCEKNPIAQGDYLCEDCRYGNRGPNEAHSGVTASRWDNWDENKFLPNCELCGSSSTVLTDVNGEPHLYCYGCDGDNDMKYPGLSWQSGKAGKGLLFGNGEVHNWNTDEYGAPHHGAYNAYTPAKGGTAATFEIGENGELHLYGNRLGNDEAAKQILQQDNRLHIPDWSLSHVTAEQLPLFEEPKAPYSVKELDLGSPTAYQDNWVGGRRPTVYDPDTKTVYIGGYGSHHGEVGDKAGLPNMGYDLPNGWLVDKNAPGNWESEQGIGWWNIDRGELEAQEKAEVEAFLRQHFGLDEQENWNFSKTATQVQEHDIEQSHYDWLWGDPQGLGPNDQGRRPMVWDPHSDTVHIGPPGFHHADIEQAAQADPDMPMGVYRPDEGPTWWVNQENDGEPYAPEFGGKEQDINDALMKHLPWQRQDWEFTGANETQVFQIPDEQTDPDYHGTEKPFLYLPEHNHLWMGSPGGVHAEIRRDSEFQKTYGGMWPHAAEGRYWPDRDKALTFYRDWPAESTSAVHKALEVPEQDWGFTAATDDTPLGAVAPEDWLDVRVLDPAAQWVKTAAIDPPDVSWVETHGSQAHGGGHPFLYSPDEHMVFIGPPGAYHADMDVSSSVNYESVAGRVDPDNIKYYSDEFDPELQGAIQKALSNEPGIDFNEGAYPWHRIQDWGGPDVQKDWKFSGGPKSWRDHRKWDRFPPKMQAFGHALKQVLPNTKYGNMLAPWFFRHYQQGNIKEPRGSQDYYAYENPPHRDYINALRAYKNADPAFRADYKWELEGAKQNIRDNAQNYALKGWPRQEDNYVDEWGSPLGYDPDYMEQYSPRNGSIQHAANQIIPFMKAMARKGTPINPKAFTPESLATAINQWETERMKDGGKVLHDYGDGWSIRQLVKPEDAHYEGKYMDNCVGEYADEVRNRKILSLRDEKNKPHVTWEEEPHYSGDYNIASSILGKGNADPKPIYKARLKHYYESMPYEQRPHSEDESGLIASHTDLGQATVDDYGLPAIPSYNWPALLESAWQTDPSGKRQPGYYPENVEKLWQVANNTDERADILRGLNTLGDNFRIPLENLQQEGGPAYEGLKQSPYLQTMADFENRAQGAGWDFNPVVSPHIASVKTLRRAHIAPSGFACNCKWGDSRPDWTPEWETETHWREDGQAGHYGKTANFLDLSLDRPEDSIHHDDLGGYEPDDDTPWSFYYHPESNTVFAGDKWTHHSDLVDTDQIPPSAQSGLYYPDNHYIDYFGDPAHKPNIMPIFDQQFGKHIQDWNLAKTATINIQHIEPNIANQNHGSGAPFYYHPDSQTLYLGPKGVYHHDLLGNKNMIDLPPHEELKTGRIDEHYIDWYDWLDRFGPEGFEGPEPEPKWSPEEKGAIKQALKEHEFPEWSDWGSQEAAEPMYPWDEWDDSTENNWRLGHYQIQEVGGDANDEGNITDIDYRRPWRWFPKLNQIYLGQPGQYHSEMELPQVEGYGHAGYAMSPLYREEGEDPSRPVDDGGISGEVNAFSSPQEVPDEVIDAVVNHLGEGHWNARRGNPNGEWGFDPIPQRTDATKTSAPYPGEVTPDPVGPPKIKEWDFDPESAGGWYDDFRRPFIYDRDNHTVHVGPQGGLHGDLSEIADIPYANTGGLLLENHKDPKSINDAMGYNILPPGILDAVKRHYGLLDGPAEWKIGASEHHRLNWQPGQEGKGFIIKPIKPDDDREPIVWTWPTDHMRPTHPEMAVRTIHDSPQGMKYELESAFHIEPNGSLWQFGGNRVMRDENAQTIMQADPNLTTETDPEFQQWVDNIKAVNEIGLPKTGEVNPVELYGLKVFQGETPGRDDVPWENRPLIHTPHNNGLYVGQNGTYHDNLLDEFSELSKAPNRFHGFIDGDEVGWYQKPPNENVKRVEKALGKSEPQDWSAFSDLPSDPIDQSGIKDMKPAITGY